MKTILMTAFAFVLSANGLPLKLCERTYWATQVQRAEPSLIKAPEGAVQVLSTIQHHRNLVKLAEEAGKDLRLQRELDRLLQAEITGLLKGDARVPLGNAYFELRSEYGARLFIKRFELGETKYVIVVGKGTKKHLASYKNLFNAMRAAYFDMPEFKS